MKIMAVVSLLILACTHLYAGEQLVLYRIGEMDQPSWGLLRQYFIKKGYTLNIYESTGSIEKHIENANRINRGKRSLLLAVDFKIGEGNHVLVAVTEGKRGQGSILSIEEVSAAHLSESRECARIVASFFHKKVKEFPLLPLTGIDMPGIFVKIECTKDKTEDMLSPLHDGLQRYFKKSP